LRYFQRQDTSPDVKRQPVTWRRNPNERSVRLQTLSYGNQAGGGTVHYGSVSCASTRTTSAPLANDRALWSVRDPGRLFARRLALSYADLEPYYDRAEYELGVSGKAGNLQGRKVDGGNVFEAPRKREYPLPPLQMDQSGANFDAAGKKLGYHPFSTPRAILSQPYNGRPACSYCGFCQAFGCHIGAKSSISSPSCPRPTRPATSSSSPARCATASTATTAGA